LQVMWQHKHRPPPNKTSKLIIVDDTETTQWHSRFMLSSTH
jgi:hypothetical protein